MGAAVAGGEPRSQEVLANFVGGEYVAHTRATLASLITGAPPDA